MSPIKPGARNRWPQTLHAAKASSCVIHLLIFGLLIISRSAAYRFETESLLSKMSVRKQHSFDTLTRGIKFPSSVCVHLNTVTDRRAAIQNGHFVESQSMNHWTRGLRWVSWTWFMIRHPCCVCKTLEQAGCTVRQPTCHQLQQPAVGSECSG